MVRPVGFSFAKLAQIGQIHPCRGFRCRSAEDGNSAVEPHRQPLCTFWGARAEFTCSEMHFARKLLVELCLSASQWLTTESGNLLVVHCRSGNGTHKAS